VCSRIAAAASTRAALTVWVAPTLRAASSLSSRTSTAMIAEAPSDAAIWITFDPTPPVATTATVSPACNPA
jgi:hypothetical protein